MDTNCEGRSAMTEHARDAEAIFLAALDKATPQERAAYVEATCGADLELLRRVPKLLGCHEGSQGPPDAPPPCLRGTVNLSAIIQRTASTSPLATHLPNLLLAT